MNMGEVCTIDLPQLKVMSEDGNPQQGKEFKWGKGYYWRIESVNGSHGVVKRIPGMTVQAAATPEGGFTETPTEAFHVLDHFDDPGSSTDVADSLYPFGRPRHSGPLVSVKQDPAKTVVLKPGVLPLPTTQEGEERRPRPISNPQLIGSGSVQDGRAISMWWAQCAR